MELLPLPSTKAAAAVAARAAHLSWEQPADRLATPFGPARWLALRRRPGPRVGDACAPGAGGLRNNSLGRPQQFSSPVRVGDGLRAQPKPGRPGKSRRRPGSGEGGSLSSSLDCAACSKTQIIFLRPTKLFANKRLQSFDLAIPASRASAPRASLSHSNRPIVVVQIIAGLAWRSSEFGAIRKSVQAKWISVES